MAGNRQRVSTKASIVVLLTEDLGDSSSSSLSTFCLHEQV